MIVGSGGIVRFFDSILGDYILYGCASAFAIDINTEFIETSVTGTGVMRTFKPAGNSFTGSMDGLINLNDPSMISAQDLIQKQLDHVLMDTEFVFTDPEGNSFTVTAQFYISDSGLTGDTSKSGFSIQMQGTGNITMSHINIDGS